MLQSHMKNLKFLVILLTTYCLTVQTMAQKKIELYSTIPDVKANCKTTEVEEAPGLLKDVLHPDLTVFTPEKQNFTKAAILIIPGGGYTHLAIAKEGYDVAKKFAELGITAFVLKYRMPIVSCFENSQFVPLMDAQKSMEYIRNHASEYNIDANNVGVIGFSAGGHLASCLLTMPNNKQINTRQNLLPNWGILGYPVIDMSYKYTHTSSREHLIGKGASEEEVKDFSTQYQVSKSTPPTFLFLAQDDDIVNPMNSIVFYQSMLQNNIKGELHIMQNGGHGFGLHNQKSLEHWFTTATKWLKINKWIQ